MQSELEPVFEIMNKNRQIYEKTKVNRDYYIKKFIKLGYDLSKYENLILLEEGIES